MTSTVTARLRPGTGFAQVLARIFPCGSVTGAPKIRAMEVIRALEPEPRGVYTGAVGAILADGRMRFNVAIRTLVIDRHGRGELGVGSGVVQDSDAAAEFEECRMKARFATRPAPPPFCLIETLRWEPGMGFYLLDRHLDRLAASAAYFARPWDRERMLAALLGEAERFGAMPMRVRLLMDDDGTPAITAQPLTLPGPETMLSFVVSPQPVDSRDPFLFHKTTHRPHYDAEMERWKRAAGCDEVIFVNERGEVTEGSWTSLFAECDGVLLTPPLTCGLLDGTLRRELLEAVPAKAREAVLTLADLRAADRVFLGNSVRGLLAARERRA